VKKLWINVAQDRDKQMGTVKKLWAPQYAGKFRNV
jgi:hypothetical protein